MLILCTDKPPIIDALRSHADSILLCGEGVLWDVYRRISHYLIEQGGDGQMTPVLRLGAGAVAGIVGDHMHQPTCLPCILSYFPVWC